MWPACSIYRLTIWPQCGSSSRVFASLTCVTEAEIAPIKGGPLNPTVDHLCLDTDLAARVTSVRGWHPGETEAGRRLSDHTGVYVHLAP